MRNKKGEENRGGGEEEGGEGEEEGPASSGLRSPSKARGRGRSPRRRRRSWRVSVKNDQEERN